jgi:transposase
MILSSAVQAFICAEPVDMRKSIDGLAALVGPLLGHNAFSGQVFVFVGRRRNKVKCLLWDRTGFWCLYKRIERGRLPDPRVLARTGISMVELAAWIEGIDTTRARTVSPVKATLVG